jgi:hypothetical protein
MRNVATGSVAVGLTAFALHAAAAGLDGKTFQGQIRDDKGVVRAKDVVTFKNGLFHSVNCARFGFDAAPYWTRVDGGVVHFLVESAHPENGTMLFKGAIRGNIVEWSAVWTKKRWYWSIRREISFRGEEQR